MGKSSEMSKILVKGLSVAGYYALINVIPRGGDHGIGWGLRSKTNIWGQTSQPVG